MKISTLVTIGVFVFLSILSLTIGRADWSSVPVGGGGFITGMAMSSDGTGIYVRTDVGGSYRWIPSTASWKPLNDMMPNDGTNDGPGLGINSLAVAPDNANKLYVATGAYTWTSPSGLYVTDDSSVANPVWTVIDSTIRSNANGSIRAWGERLAVDPNNTTVIYYGTNNVSGGGTGLKKYVLLSSWVASSLYAQPAAIGDANYGITFVACDKNGGTVSDGARTVSKYIYLGVFSATVGSGGIYASSNGGLSWTKVTGVSIDKPSRGEVSPDGTLYVTFPTGVAKVSRGTTTSTDVTPATGHAYVALAIDPSNAGTVMVANDSSSNIIYRSLDHGNSGTWTTVSRTVHGTEPDGTPSGTTNGGLDNISDLMINPTNANEVWTGDFLSVQRTQNVGTTPSDWYCLQKNIEEIVPLSLKSPPTGAPLMISSADVDGYAQGDMGSRSISRFNNPPLQQYGGSTTSLDFCESTYSGDTVLARAFDNFSGSGIGGVSIDDGNSWLRFGQVAGHVIYNNSTTPGWEEFDVSAYLIRQKALGNNSITLVVGCDDDLDVSSADTISFDSKEGTNHPQLLLNGSITLGATADAWVFQNSTATNYNTTKLLVGFQTGWAGANRRAFLNFDLTTVTSVTSAKLRLYRNTSLYNHYFPTGIYGIVPAAWNETTLTWANQPTLLSGSNFQYWPAVPSGAHGGRVAVSATDPANIVWVGESGAVYYSKDRGVTWLNGTLGGTNLAISALSEFTEQKNPLASDRVAVGTFYLFADNVGGGTIYRSTDGGVTWASLVALADTYAPRPQYKIAGVPGASGFWIMTENWNYPVAFKYWNGTGLVTIPNITNVVDFAFGKGLGANPAAYIRKADNTYWTSTDATAGSSFTWSQMTGLTSLAVGPDGMEGDRQNFGRLYISTSGRGVMYTGGSTTRSFYAQDSTVRDGTYATGNQAGTTSTTIDTKTDVSPYNREGYLQFDFSSYTGTVSSASITLNPIAAGMSGIQNQVSLVASNAWTEDAITWNNKPASSTVLATYTVAAGTPVTIYVTSQVAAAMATGKVLSIRVTCASAANTGNLVNYASSENPTLSLQPVLNITP